MKKNYSASNQYSTSTPSASSNSSVSTSSIIKRLDEKLLSSTIIDQLIDNSFSSIDATTFYKELTHTNSSKPFRLLVVVGDNEKNNLENNLDNNESIKVYYQYKDKGLPVELNSPGNYIANLNGETIRILNKPFINDSINLWHKNNNAIASFWIICILFFIIAVMTNQSLILISTLLVTSLMTSIWISIRKKIELF